MDRSGTWAILPIKTFRHAKQRLAAVLTATERAELARAMAGGRAERACREPGSGRHSARDRRPRGAATRRTLRRTRPAGGRGARPHRRQQPRRSHPGAGRRGRHGPGAGGHPSGDSGGHRRAACGPWRGAGDHARPLARRAGHQCGGLLPGRRDAAALRRRQLRCPSAARAGTRHRAADRAPPRARARHRHARRPRGVPRRAVGDPRLRLSDRERHRQAHQPPHTRSVSCRRSGRAGAAAPARRRDRESAAGRGRGRGTPGG